MMKPPLRQPRMLALYLFTLGVGVPFALLLLFKATEPTGSAFMRWRGVKVPLDWPLARFVFAALGGGLLLLLGWSAVRAIRSHLAQAPAVPAEMLDLEPGESTRWSGRLGVRSLQKQHAIIAAMIPPMTLPLILSTWWIFAGSPSLVPGVEGSLFRAASVGVILAVFGPMAIGPFWMVLAKENRWLHSVLGTVVVTDRRLLWRRAPDGKIAQQLELAAIEDAVLVQSREGRGEVHLTVRTHPAKVEEQVIAGVPEPEMFIASLRPTS